MKRDMDLVREILLAVEAAPLNIDGSLTLEGRDHRVVAEHVRLLLDAGYLSTARVQYVAGKRMDLGLALSWAGHEFLETIRDPQIWMTAKSGATKLGSWSLSVLAELAKAAIKAKAIELGLPLDLG